MVQHPRCSWNSMWNNESNPAWVCTFQQDFQVHKFEDGLLPHQKAWWGQQIYQICLCKQEGILYSIGMLWMISCTSITSLLPLCNLRPNQKDFWESQATGPDGSTVLERAVSAPYLLMFFASDRKICRTERQFQDSFWIFSSCLMDLISQESPKAAIGVAVERFKRQKVLFPKPPSKVERVKLRDGHLGCQGCSTMFLQLQECLGFVFFFQCAAHLTPIWRSQLQLRCTKTCGFRSLGICWRSGSC